VTNTLALALNGAYQSEGRHETQHIDIEHNDTQHIDTQHNSRLLLCSVSFILSDIN
jgi:hypothetical protein